MLVNRIDDRESAVWISENEERNLPGRHCIPNDFCAVEVGKKINHLLFMNDLKKFQNVRQSWIV